MMASFEIIFILEDRGMFVPRADDVRPYIREAYFTPLIEVENACHRADTQGRTRRSAPTERRHIERRW